MRGGFAAHTHTQPLGGAFAIFPSQCRNTSGVVAAE